MSSELYTELLRLIEQQGQLITKLTNENTEQENMINALLSDEIR
ncbi:hypothetical protein [Mesobacillus stamsii]|uniref:Uncharacterized protein n=1 Tax=Mesobacillus stamsii TaxID=225347 RepID=A0ABU0FXB2_9BACI|nr:hypothetical protein [Mesobacillus stamsii]MDQ0414577.1 hypothetical protein [Mesobacillus stamsii]